MLDDLKWIHEKDPQDALGIAEKQGQQVDHVFEFVPALEADHVYNVVLAGMGGSALAALLSLTWPRYKEPFEIVRGYDIPAYVDGDTLFIASSYSGNTEETLSALEKAEAKKAQIVVIASGGKLAEQARAKGYPLAILPSGYQPRYAVLYNLKALVTILERAGVVAQDSAEQTLQGTAGFLRDTLHAWRPDVPTKDNLAKQIAQELMGRSPVVYGGPLLFPAAYKWKISFNENAKNVAWCNEFPEFNHNEFIGWSSHPVDKPYGVIELRSSLEHPQVQKRFDVTNRLLSGRWPEPIVVEAQGQTLLEHLLYCVMLGDFVSIYLALLNGVNPTPVDLVEKFKKALND